MRGIKKVGPKTDEVAAQTIFKIDKQKKTNRTWIIKNVIQRSGDRPSLALPASHIRVWVGQFFSSFLILAHMFRKAAENGASP